MKRTIFTILLAVFLPVTVGSVCSAQVSCTFYEHESFGEAPWYGWKLEVQGEKKANVPGDKNDEITSIEVAPCYQVTVYSYWDHDKNEGWWRLGPGRYNMIDNDPYGLQDRISSYEVVRAFDVTGISMTEGVPGDDFYIEGKGFYRGVNVKIGEISVSHYVMSDTRIKVTVGDEGGKVKVRSDAGCSWTSPEYFKICPVINSINVTEGFPGDKLIINGQGFVNVSGVKIGDESVDYTRLSKTEIEVTVGEKSGKVTVATKDCPNGTASKEDFTVPGAGFTYYDIRGNEIESEDQHLIEKNAVKRVDTRQGKTEYRLEVGHDFSDSDLSTGYLENFGNPTPQTGKYWILPGDGVLIRVDGIVYEPTRATRHVCTGYTLSSESGGRFVDHFMERYPQDENELSQTKYFTGPAKIFFRWKTQYSLQVMSMPAAMGDELTPKADVYWYDADTSVSSSASDGCLKVEGYRDNIKALAETVPGKTKTYVMNRPVQITWFYEAHNYEETVTIGNPITFSTVPASVITQADTGTEPVKPTSADPSQVSQSTEELYYWSISDKQLFPLIGGRTFQVEWKNKEGGKCEQKLISTIHTKWPDSPHYIHVAETPAVPLDPRVDDEFAFVSLKYAEKGDKVQVASGGFTASEAGKSTLLFTKVSSGAAVGDENVESAYIRVVETRVWTTGLEEGNAEIGTEITSRHHAPGTPHNGYVFWDRARYNVNVYDRPTMQGQIFPVNRHFTGSREDDLVVVWYHIRDNISWPCQSVKYDCNWPEQVPRRIVIASREGSECRDSKGVYQTWPDRDNNLQNYLDPARYKDVMIYQQPDPRLPGYNPNEEHAVATSSFRHKDMASAPVAAFALRDDLNITDQDETHTSENYVLLQYYDLAESEHGMDVFRIDREDPGYDYVFEYPMYAGDPVVAPYPLNQVIGAAPPSEISGINGDSERNSYWEDHKGQAWAVSGDAHLLAYFWYPLAPEFWYEKDHNGKDASKGPGDPIPWLPAGTVGSSDGFPADMLGKPKAVKVRYDTGWPDEVPVLKAGETVTFAGGEYRADYPQTREGLPMVLGWAAGQVVFDDLNPAMKEEEMFDSYLVRLVQALEERTVDLPVTGTDDDEVKMPDELKPAAGRVKVMGGRWYFQQLHAGLKTRVFYDPLMSRKDTETGEVISIGKLGIRGFVNGKTLGDEGLTASPPSVYVLQLNILTEEEWGTLRGLEGANTAFQNAVDALYNLTRDPANFKDDEGAYTVGFSDARKELQAYQKTLFKEQFKGICGSLHSLCPNFGFDDICKDLMTLYPPDPSETDSSGTGETASSGQADSSVEYPFPGMALGPGLALVPSAKLLDPSSGISGGYVTVAENNHPSLGSLPVALHIINVKNDKYRGAIKTIMPDNVFDEKITLRHTADFGANPGDAVFEWRYREEDGTGQPPPDTAPAGTWQAFPGKGPEIAMEGAGAALLTDNLVFCRYRHTKSDGDDPESWSEWAGAANSRPPKEGEDPSETFQAQLAEGWVKRVMNGLNPFEARISDFYSSDSPATYTSMIRQAGPRFEGAVAFNPDKDVIENVGLIELYQTVLNRAEDLSINLAQTEGSSGVYTALLLAASRIAGFYTLLGNEAYTDALDPTIGFGTESVEYGSLAPTIFTFMNQVPTLLDEELALLRGREEEGARPVYNRLLWNFTKAEGEAAYALSYNLADVNKDGFIDEADGRATYPQGHGDAYGHYMAALKGYYDLLGHKYFKWEPRSEKFQIEGVVMDVDYFDERKFAETAAAKAKTGREIVNLTYRSKYVEDPDGQWQGYTDTYQNRAWGLEGWGRRTATGALFDWAVANAILPSSVAFKLTQADMNRLERDGVRLIVRNELFHIQDQGYRTEDEFMTDVRKAMDKAVEKAESTGDPITEEKALEYGTLVLEIADNNGLKRVDRTTVPDIPEIASQARQIQQEYDHANTGLNPLGLATDAVPFDIDPSRMVPGAYNAATQFEQVYERAMNAMENAQVVFNHANDLKNRIRQVANDTETFTEQVIDQDRDYRNRLIEVFGTPYEGTIGSGKVYPAGYKGPDYFLYMYIDVNEVSEETVPPPSSKMKAFFQPMNEDVVKAVGVSGFFESALFNLGKSYMPDIPGFGVNIPGVSIPDVSIPGLVNIPAIDVPGVGVDIPGIAMPDQDDGGISDIPSAFKHFFGTDLEEASVTASDFSKELEIEFPMSAGKYSFQAPADWGMRRSPGEIHQALIELVKAEAGLQLSMADYAGLMADIQIATDLLKARSDLNAEELRIGDEWAAKTVAFNVAIAGADKLQAGFNALAAETKETTNAAVESMPKVVGLSSDATSSARGVLKVIGSVAKKVSKGLALVAGTAKTALEQEKEIAEMDKDTNIQKVNYHHDIQQQLKEIEGHMGNEAPKRMAVFKAQEHMRQISEKYRAVLAKGLRLMEERKAFNAKVAAKTQGKRYMDMAFRLNMNNALSKYRSMFDLASRYSYLAAKAYDYETNLSDRDPASAKPLLTDIVKKRTLGQYQDDRYIVGRGGLGDILARMAANFDALKGQMGFNNPQTETGRFSLRHELFRIKEGAGTTSYDDDSATPGEVEAQYRRVQNDEDWRNVLQTCRVKNLWAIPAFRKFCRPFTQEDEGAQPGLVIEFASNVIFGKNFFGWPLGGGDHAYDPTNFATKVRSVGLWFDGYDNSKLSETPRAYLIPAGMDVMLVPNSTDLDSREWTVVDQKLPVPLPVGDSDLNNPDWIPSLDSLDGPMTQIRRYSSFRAYHDSGYFDANQMSYDSRLIGRSVWNSRWVLIIPGGTFHYDTNQGLDTFIDTVTDIKLFFQTYAMSGGKK